MPEPLRLYREMTTFLMLFHIFAMGPSAPRRLENLMLKIYSFTTIVSIGVAYYFTPVYQYDDDPYHRTINMVDHFTLQVSHLIVVIQAVVHRRTLYKIINKCALIDNRFNSQLSIVTNYLRWKCAMWLKLIIFSSIILVFDLIVKYCFAICVENQFLSHLKDYYATIAVRFRCIQMIIFVQLIHDRLKIVKHALHEVLTIYKNSFVQRSRETAFGYQRMDTFAFEKILHLKEIYGQIYDTSISMNKVFGLSMLVATTQHFSEFTRNMFAITVSGVIHKMGLAHCIVAWHTWALFQIGCIYVTLAIMCHSCTMNVSLYLTSCGQWNYFEK